MNSADNIIHAAWIMTGEITQPILENHALIIENGLIKAILPSKEAQKTYPNVHSETFPHHAIIPGLINAHTHLAMNYFRGLADDLSLMNWLNHYIWPAEKKWVSEEFVYDASLLAMAEMLRSGTTCFNDMYFFLDATAQAADKAGIRGAIGMTIIDVPTAWAKTAEEYFAKGLAFFAKYKNHPRLTVTVAPHSIYTVSDEHLVQVQEIAEQYDLKINMHVHETEHEIQQSLKLTHQRPLARLQQLGLITPRLMAIHMTHVNEEDLTILQAGKPTIVHCPESNMKLASGICPVAQLQTQGLTVALGTDGAASNNDLNMLGEMRSAAFLAKLHSRNPECLSAAETLQMATLNGAKALGLDALIGSLSVGKSADFAAIHLQEIETYPLYHPLSQIIYSAGRNQVTDVWVGGKQLLKNRELLTLDEKELLAKAAHWREKIAGRK